MSERKYTDEQIVKALECFSVGVGCKGCPFIDQGCFDCGNIPTEFSESVLALINRQKAEIAVLTTAVDNSTKEFLKLHDEYQDQKAEIERLKAEQMMADGYADALEERAKVEAIKEFAARLKANMCHGYPYLEIEEDLFRRDVDNLVAEMTEGK